MGTSDGTRGKRAAIEAHDLQHLYRFNVPNLWPRISGRGVRSKCSRTKMEVHTKLHSIDPT